MVLASSDPVFGLCSEFVEAFAKQCPVQASMAGVPGVYSGWDDLSPAGAQRTSELVRSYQRRVAALPATTDRWAGHARQVALSFFDEKLSYYDSQDHLRDLNNIECPAQHMRVVFDVMGSETREEWEAIATRLETIDRPLEGYAEALRAGAELEQRVARRQVAAVIKQAEKHASEGSSFHAISQAYAATPHPDVVLQGRIDAGVRHARASYAKFGSFLESQLAGAATTDAFGEERYVRSAYRFLGANIDPKETYAWGVAEVFRIEGLMSELADQIAKGESTRAVIEKLKTSPDQLVESTERFLELMRERQERALSELMGKHFDVPQAIRRLDVKLAPPGGALGAYYIPPSDGFSRPGTVYYAPADDAKFTLFSEITTAYHEGFPGHHLQCGLQVYFADRLSQLHRLFVVCSGYAEGWALYAEQLMDELGYFDRPEYVLGMWMAKLFRSIRVVVDIGMHLGYVIPEGFAGAGEVWGFERCVEALTERGFIDREFAESEATRYLGWPGQAISYKVGERVIVDLRAELKEQLGSQFNLRAFHDSVLSTGSVGLDLLTNFVRAELT